MRDTVGKQQRQRDVIGDAFGTHILEDRKARALRIVQPASDLLALGKTIISGLVTNPGASRMSKSTVPISTSAPGRQMKLRP